MDVGAVIEMSKAYSGDVGAVARDNRESVTCSVCGKKGHIAQECYTVVGHLQKKSQSGGKGIVSAG